MAVIARFVEEVLNIKGSIAGVSYVSEPMGEISTYETFFGAPVTFNAASNALVFHRDRMNDEPSQKSLELFRFVAEHFGRRLAELKRVAQPSDFQRLTLAIEENVAAGQFNAAAIAARTHMSVRSAQRLAKANGTSLREMLHAVRINTSMDLLKDRRFDVEAIATYLGYSDSRAFRRAFKRKTGLTPKEFRNVP